MKQSRLRTQLGAITVARAGINTGYRMVYPFLPVLARGLGVDPSAVILAVTARAGLGLASPLIGPLGDVRGRKLAMMLGIGVFVVGMAMVGAWPSYLTFFLGMLAISLSKVLFDPAELAYLGDRFSYERRGLAIGISEFGWSGAFLIGVPLAAWLIDRGSWISPFPWLAAFMLASGFLLWRALPRDGGGSGSRPRFSAGFRAIQSQPPALAMLLVSALIAAANEGVGIVYGLWMEGSFGLQVAALGAASAVIGLAELGGEGLVAGLVDRIGKRRAVAFGIALCGAASLALPILGVNVPGALIGLFLLYLTFEFTVVSAIPLISEQVPAARATLLSANISAFSLGRALGAWMGGPLFESGLRANTSAAAGLYLLALIILLGYVREHE